MNYLKNKTFSLFYRQFEQSDNEYLCVLYLYQIETLF